MAVYALQKIYLINWYDFAEFAEYKNKLLDDSTDFSDETPQVWLQNILTNSSKREILINCWKARASEENKGN